MLPKLKAPNSWLFPSALFTGAFSAHLMIQWGWYWDTSLLGWNLLITACAAGFGLGLLLPQKIAKYTPLAFTLGWIPWWTFHPALGLLGLGLLLCGWSGFLRRVSQKQYILVGYGTAAGVTLSYLFFMPANLALWLWVCGIYIIASCTKLMPYTRATLCLMLIVLQIPFASLYQVHHWKSKVWTPDGWLIVWEDEENLYLGFLRGTKLAPQSRLLKSQPMSPQDYVKSATLIFLTDTKSTNPRVLDLGTGGGAFARWASQQTDKTVSVDASAAVWSVVPQHFPMPKNVKWVKADARDYLTDTPQPFDWKQQFDWIYVDLYRFNEPPSHTLTREFWMLVKQRSDPDATIVLNVLTTEDWWAPLASTFKSVFPEAQFLPLNGMQGMLIVAPQLPPTGVPFPPSSKPLTDNNNYVIK